MSIDLTDDILWNYRFVDVLKTTSNGSRYIDDRKFHDVMPINN